MTARGTTGARKLSLNREMLRRLDAHELHGVQGGFASRDDPKCDDYTKTCETCYCKTQVDTDCNTNCAKVSCDTRCRECRNATGHSQGNTCFCPTKHCSTPCSFPCTQTCTPACLTDTCNVGCATTTSIVCVTILL